MKGTIIMGRHGKNEAARIAREASRFARQHQRPPTPEQRQTRADWSAFRATLETTHHQGVLRL